MFVLIFVVVGRNLRNKTTRSSPVTVAALPHLEERDAAIKLAALVLDEQLESPYLAAKQYYGDSGEQKKICNLRSKINHRRINSVPTTMRGKAFYPHL